MAVRAFIDAGALFCKSTKQKIVTKSSTEAELVDLLNTTAQAIHMRNFVQAQGYEIGPEIIYQGNMNCMALDLVISIFVISGSVRK